jgi:hypothetical protein
MRAMPRRPELPLGVVSTLAMGVLSPASKRKRVPAVVV